MSWGETVGGIEHARPDEIAFDLGWCDGFEGREMRGVHGWVPDEARAYHDGYRLGEQQSGRAKPPRIEEEALELIAQVHDRRAGIYVAAVVLAAVVVMVGLVVWR